MSAAAPSGYPEIGRRRNGTVLFAAQAADVAHGMGDVVAKLDCVHPGCETTILWDVATPRPLRCADCGGHLHPRGAR